MKNGSLKKRLLSGIICIFVIAALFATACGSKPDSGDVPEPTVSAEDAGTAQDQQKEPDAGTTQDQQKEPDDAGTVAEIAFASESMTFSFLYDAAHTAYITDMGAAELAINGDSSLIGLFVSVSDAENLPTVASILEEDMFSETQKYQNAIAEPPVADKIVVEDHVLEGYTFSYSTRQGETVDATYYIENRDGKYIFYRTEAYRDTPDYQAGQDALEKAVLTLEFSSDAYGPGSAKSGEIGTDNTPL